MVFEVIRGQDRVSKNAIDGPQLLGWQGLLSNRIFLVRSLKAVAARVINEDSKSQFTSRKSFKMGTGYYKLF